ncbi:MAG: maleylpyruvate isomerase N-terminal domain-containing protein [Sporichthyaceae bacterium]
MNATATLHAARGALTETAARLVALVASLPDATAPILYLAGSEPSPAAGTWTVRECAVHLAVEVEGCIEVVRGAPAPYVYTDIHTCNAEGAAKIADNPESDPRKLAGLLLDASERLTAATANRSGDQPVDFWGVAADVSQVVALELGEFVMHGYDIAKAVGRPWAIDPATAQLALHGYAPCLQLCAAKDVGGHTAGYLIEVREGPALVVRFLDGKLSIEPPGGPVDASLSVDAAAFLFVAFGRMSLLDAIALRLIAVGGPDPELALRFFDRFDIP